MTCNSTAKLERKMMIIDPETNKEELKD